MSFKLVEAGSSRSMLAKNVSNMNYPVEKIGNNQFRTYIDETDHLGM